MDSTKQNNVNKKAILQTSGSLLRLLMYNMRIIFGGKFFWFIIISFVLFFYSMFNSAYKGVLPNESLIYEQLVFPAMLLMFYPAVFGIQNDEDNRILEILFGIPNYMYKIWMTRLLMIFVEVYFIIVAFGYVANFLLYPINPFEMAYHIMYPVIFYGCLAFLYSTLMRNGNSTAVLIIITYFILNILSSSLFNNSMWNLLLNPYNIPTTIHPAIWDSTVINNRLLLGIGGVVWMMLGLFNLQKREKFI